MDIDDELGTSNLLPINEINPSQDFNWQQENTNKEPLQDLNPQQETPEPELLLPHVDTNQGHQLNQAAEPSPELSRKGARTKLSEFQRKLNKRESDRTYRQKQKNMLENLKKEKEDLEKRAEEMKSENEHLKEKVQHLEKEIKDRRHEVITSQRDDVHVNKMIMELIESQTCNATVPAAKAEFFRKLEEDEESYVDFKDFTITDLHEKQEYRTVGKYQIPLSLVTTAEKITKVHGDVCATSKINPKHAREIYILFCATIKEMSELPPEKVTEKTMLKWRDAIKDALRIQFKVEFAMEHLKKTIAPRYFGMKAYEEGEKIDVDISKVGTSLNRFKEYLNDLEECKKFIDIAREFDDKPFSEGLWG